MEYTQALDYLMNQLPMYQRIGKAAYKADLSNAILLDHYFKHPHTHFPCIHVAGTNGKGSVSSLLASVLQEGGYKTGLFTSPHLLDFRERIRINGEAVSKNYVTDFVRQHKSFFAQFAPSFFEISVFMAFSYFQENQVDIAVIETGLGGRLDTTNIINPLLSVITNIGMDHTQILGNTLSIIAREKAGIIKAETPVVIGKTQADTLPVFSKVSSEKGAPIHIADSRFQCVAEESEEPLAHSPLQRIRIKDLHHGESRLVACGLTGACQAENVGTVMQCLDVLEQQGFVLPEEAVLLGLQHVVKNTGLRGRWQWLGAKPDILCDVAHNSEGLHYVFTAIKALPHRHKNLLLGFVEDKELDKLWASLPSDCNLYISKPSVERGMDTDKVLAAAKKNNFPIKGVFPTLAEGYERILAECRPDDLLFIGGSTFMVSDLLRLKQTEAAPQ